MLFYKIRDIGKHRRCEQSTSDEHLSNICGQDAKQNLLISQFNDRHHKLVGKYFLFDLI